MTTQEVRNEVCRSIDAANSKLWDINKLIFDNPELAFEEHQAHDNIVNLLRSMDFEVTEHAYGLKTAFVAEFGSGGRVVCFNAEYDALPGIGHACGHNLIAVSSLASFIGLAAALKASGIPGRARILGTPAEEAGGGKALLIEAGAYKDVDACLMAHPGPAFSITDPSVSGAAYMTSLAMAKFTASFSGKPAHAAMAPYQGVNALDAATLSYNGISMLRQQTKEYDRIHAVVKEGGSYSNVIPDATLCEYQVRSKTRREALELRERVMNCAKGACLATGCTVEFEQVMEYADLRPNKSLCLRYAEAMESLGSPVLCQTDGEAPGPGSTDQGNVSYVCPSFQSGFIIKTDPGAFNHTPGFTSAAGTSDSHNRAVTVGKGMGLTGWSILSNEDFALQVKSDFSNDPRT